MGYVYKIINTVNQKSYIGISIHEPEKRRIRNHLSGNGNRILANAVKKYGREAFVSEILEENVFDEFLPDLEIAYIAKFNTVSPNGYNLTHGGEGCVPSAETRRKMSEVHTGKKHSAESRRKMSEAKKGRIPWIKGKTHNKETRRKISEEAKNRLPISAETRRKLSEAHTGKKQSVETRRKLSKANKGKKHSAETRRKISEATKGRTSQNKSPDRIPARKFFLSLPSDMNLREKRRLLFQKFPERSQATIYSWIREWIQDT